jgi:hypothetical protein
VQRQGAAATPGRLCITSLLQHRFAFAWLQCCNSNAKAPLQQYCNVEAPLQRCSATALPQTMTGKKTVMTGQKLSWRKKMRVKTGHNLS